MTDTLQSPLRVSAAFKSLAAALLLLGCAAAQAQSSPWRVYGGLGLADGGDTVVSGTIVTDGTNKVLPFKIKAGGGVQIRAGMEYRFTDRVSAQGSVGYVISDPMGYNGSFTFTNVPVEAMAFFNLTEALRLGAGVRKSTATLKGTGVVAYSDVNGDYSGSVGQVLEAQYLFGSPSSARSATSAQFGLSLRLVREELTHAGTTLKGDHYEIGAALYF